MPSRTHTRARNVHENATAKYQLLERSGHRWVGNTKADVRNRVMKIWTGLNWLRTRFHDRFLKLLYECSVSKNLGEFTDDEHRTRKLLRQPNDGEEQRGSGWKWRADVLGAGRETRLRCDSSVTWSWSGAQRHWQAMTKTMIFSTLLLLPLLKKYCTDFLASQPPFRATGRQLRHDSRGSYVTTAHLRPSTMQLILARTKRGCFAEHQGVRDD